MTWEAVTWHEIIGGGLIAILAVLVVLGLKGTRTIHILVGFSVVLVVLLTGQWLRLYPNEWKLTRYWLGVVLAFVVLFQPELRRALAQLGRNPFRRRNAMEETRVVEEIVKAAVSLANRRIGAIMVFEREHELLDVVEVGTLVDARASKELLTSLFVPYSTLHDGAVVLRGTRIVAAGCFLPLSTGENSVKVSGTRHRAALGITEETDAVAIAVSEETGAISLMVDGEIQRDLDAGALRARLAEILVTPSPTPSNAWFSRVRS